MKIMAVLAVGGMLAGGAVMAKPGTPGPDYFAGTYERVGRTGGDPAQMVNDLVVITPVGQNVAIRGCTGPEVMMSFGPAFEIENLMTGQAGNVDVECLFYNNGYNYPILTCQSADGGAFTLWPRFEDSQTCGG